MKILYALILLFFVSFLPVCAKDTVQSRNSIMTGKIYSYVDGLIRIEKNGMEYTYTRSKNADYFGDYIQYKEKPVFGALIDTNCRISYVDLYKVIFETQTARISIPRYRVKNIVLNTY